MGRDGFHERVPGEGLTERRVEVDKVKLYARLLRQGDYCRTHTPRACPSRPQD